VDVVYGSCKLPFGKLDRAARDKPGMKHIRVTLLDPKGGSLSKGERTLKKNLLKLTPDSYYREMSNPKFGLRERAVLQSLKPRLNSVWATLQESLRELQNGWNNVATGYLYRDLNQIKARVKWTVTDHLLYRFVQWTIGQVNDAKHHLRTFGLSAQEITMALPSRKQSNRRIDCAQLVNDKLYTTGMAFRPMTSSWVRRITEQGIPALTPISLELGSSVPRSGGPEGIRRKTGARVASLIGWKTSTDRPTGRR